VSLEPRRLRWALLAGVLLLAAALRFVGLGFGFPALTHADEPQVVMVAVNAATGQLSPGFFAYPALFPYLCGLVLRLWVLVQPWAWADFQAFFDRYCTDPQQAFLVVRACGAATGVGLVAATAWLGRRAAGPRVGLLAAAVMAVNVYAVRDAHFAVTDTPVALASALALVAILAVLEGRGLRSALVAGVAVGLAAGTKYPAGALALPLAAALAWRGWRGQGGWRVAGRDIALAALAAAVAFLVTNPFVLLDFGTFQADLAREAERRLAVSAAQFEGPAWRWYLGRTLPTAFGWAGLILAAAGAVWALAARQGKLALLLLGAAVLLVPPLLVVSVGERYLLPAYPVLAVLAAWASVQLARRCLPRGRWLANTVLAALAFALLLPPLARSVQVTRLLTLPDTRVEAARWIAETLAPGRRIALEWSYVPHVDPEVYEVLPLRYELGGPREQGADYLVVSSYAFNRYFMEPEAHAQELAFFQALEAGGPPIAVFSGLPPERAYGYVERVPPGPLDQVGLVGPEIRIYGPIGD
jgi:hypothetical protein